VINNKKITIQASGYDLAGNKKAVINDKVIDEGLFICLVVKSTKINFLWFMILLSLVESNLSASGGPPTLPTLQVGMH
jgi:hypothetical protein